MNSLTSSATQHVLRPVRSYVLRQSRLSPAQARAHASLMPVYGIGFRQEYLDAAKIFGRQAATVLEIGSGMGEATAAIAAAHPEINYLAVEVHAPGVGSLLKQIEAKGLTNLRVIQHDAVEVLRDMIAPRSLDGIHIFFPDPWPKKRHHKRRLVQPDFVALLAERLRPGAYLHLATDWPDYAEQMLALLCAEPRLENTAAGYAPRPAWRPQTKFERRGLMLGHSVRDLLFRRK